MQNKITYKNIIFIFLGLLLNQCVEPIDIDTTILEDAIVIEATITNEYKYQKIRLTRSLNFTDDIPNNETNASVIILDDLNKTYSFQEESPGIYISTNKFMAEPNKKYQLQITTSSGKIYNSQVSELPGTTTIDNLSATNATDNLGNKKISILVDSYDASSNSIYYRYEYEETYKIIAPNWTFMDMVADLFPPFQIRFEKKTEEQQVCYQTEYSNSIIQTKTNDLSEDRVSKFEVRSIPIDNPIISHRYSILVKQYIQSLASYTYYKTLNKQSSTENLFSSNQPGFIRGNVFSVNNPNELVIGYFEVTSVSSKRLFFNFKDIYPEEPGPPYFSECNTSAPSTRTLPGESDPSDLAIGINDGSIKYYTRNPNYPNPLDLNAGPYLVVSSECGDCTQLGSNIKPDFWED